MGKYTLLKLDYAQCVFQTDCGCQITAVVFIWITLELLYCCIILEGGVFELRTVICCFTKNGYGYYELALQIIVKFVSEYQRGFILL